MNDRNDDAQNVALMVLGGVVALVVGGVLTLAASRALHPHAGVGPTRTSAPTAALAGAVLGAPDGRVYFALDSDAIGPESTDEIARVAGLARAAADKTVLISGYHDASGDAAHNAELAKHRAQAVRDALVAAGVPEGRLALDKPIVATGSGDPREARRVEMRVR